KVVSQVTGGISLEARDLTQLLRSDAFGVAVAYAASLTPNSSAGALAIGVGVGRNKVRSKIKDYIDNSTVEADDNISLTAENRANVSSLGVGVAASAARGTSTTGAIA